MRTARLYGGCVVVDGTCMEGRRACGSVWEASRDGDDMYVGKEDAGRVWAGGGGGGAVGPSGSGEARNVAASDPSRMSKKRFRDSRDIRTPRSRQ